MMNNKPVAWIVKTYYPNGLFEDDLVWSKIDENSIPLYTHPVKELTDEEIMEIVVRNFGQHCYDNYFDSEWIYFARAILRKASEK